MEKSLRLLDWLYGTTTTFEGFKGQKYDINALFLALLWLDDADFNCIKCISTQWAIIYPSQ